MKFEEIKGFIGQEKITDNLMVFIEAAQKNKVALDHIILYGPPGLGKTTLANIIAKTMKSNFIIVSAPAITKKSELAAILLARKTNDIIFIDEIHRLKRDMEEMLYTVMENARLDIIMGKNNSAKSVSIPLPKFTIIGATTLFGKISAPLRNRFGITFKFEYYGVEAMSSLMKKRFPSTDSLIIEEEAYKVIAIVSRGIPRLGIKHMKRIIDYCQVNEVKVLDKSTITKFLEQLGIDHNGLDFLDRKYISLIAKNFSGGPVGVETISASLEESIETIENTVEPYLLRLGYIKKTNKGRMLSEDAIRSIRNKSLNI